MNEIKFFLNKNQHDIVKIEKIIKHLLQIFILF